METLFFSFVNPRTYIRFYVYNQQTTYKLWAQALRGEIKKLTTQDTFSIEDTKLHNFVVPTTLVFKVKLTSCGVWDKAKAKCAYKETFKANIIIMKFGLQLQ